MSTDAATLVPASTSRVAISAAAATGCCGASVGVGVTASTVGAGGLTLTLTGVGVTLLASGALDAGALVFGATGSVTTTNAGSGTVRITTTLLAETITDAALLAGGAGGSDAGAATRDRHTNRLVLTQGQTAVLGVVRAAAADATVFRAEAVACAILHTLTFQATLCIFGTGFTPVLLSNTGTVVVGVRCLAGGTVCVLALLFGASSIGVAGNITGANVGFTLTGSLATFEARRAFAWLLASYTLSIHTLGDGFSSTVGLTNLAATVFVGSTASTAVIGVGAAFGWVVVSTVGVGVAFIVVDGFLTATTGDAGTVFALFAVVAVGIRGASRFTTDLTTLVAVVIFSLRLHTVGGHQALWFGGFFPTGYSSCQNESCNA